jgi:hypothetical protein
MTGTDAWLKAFGAGTPLAVVTAVCDAWAELATKSYLSFNAKTHEPKLTELLAIHLRDTIAATRLTGLWSYESPQGQIVRRGATASVTNRRRTDITYFSDREAPPLHVVFEFKRINQGKGLRRAYAAEGMLRFIDGVYGADQPLAVMVGVVLADSAKCLSLLEDDLNRSTDLRFHPPGAQRLRSPSNAFPRQARFDTEHSRPSAGSSVVISHLFFTFPIAPPAPSRSKKLM